MPDVYLLFFARLQSVIIWLQTLDASVIYKRNVRTKLINNACASGEGRDGIENNFLCLIISHWHFESNRRLITHGGLVVCVFRVFLFSVVFSHGSFPQQMAPTHLALKIGEMYLMLIKNDEKNRSGPQRFYSDEAGLTAAGLFSLSRANKNRIERIRRKEKKKRRRRTECCVVRRGNKVDHRIISQERSWRRIYLTARFLLYPVALKPKWFKSHQKSTVAVENFNRPSGSTSCAA